MGINQHVYLGLAVDVGDEDMAVFANEDQDLFYQPYCEQVSKKCRYWLPQQSRSSCICPGTFRNAGPLVIGEGLHLSKQEEEFLQEYFPKAKREVIYVSWWS